MSDFSTLQGLTIKSVKGEVQGSEIHFSTTCGRTFKMYHEQDCCEAVFVEDIIGDLQNLVGQAIVEAYESSGEPPKDPESYDECTLWTFYHLRTFRDNVTIRWYGGSNGYYSVSVSFKETT